MRFFTDLPKSFRNGVLNATSTKRKIFAWCALILLVTMALFALVTRDHLLLQWIPHSGSDAQYEYADLPLPEYDSHLSGGYR